MGGLGVLLWLGIGAAVGWIISGLMVSAGDDALRGTAAGMIGGILGGLGMRLLGASAPAAGDLNPLLAALAGSLWLTWITCVVTSGREHRSRPRVPEVHFALRDSGQHVATGQPPLTYGVARDRLVEQLLRDAMAHEAERYDEIDRRDDDVARALPHGNAPELVRLRVAVAFRDGWIAACNRGFAPDGGIAKTEWPLLARSVAADLESNRDMTDARVVARFDVSRHQLLGERVQTLAARMRAG